MYDTMKTDVPDRRPTMIERDRLADIRAQHADRADELRRIGKNRMAEYEDEIVAICDEVRQWRLWAAGVVTHSPAIVAGRYERQEPGGDR